MWDCGLCSWEQAGRRGWGSWWQGASLTLNQIKLRPKELFQENTSCKRSAFTSSLSLTSRVQEHHRRCMWPIYPVQHFNFPCQRRASLCSPKLGLQVCTAYSAFPIITVIFFFNQSIFFLHYSSTKQNKTPSKAAMRTYWGVLLERTGWRQGQHPWAIPTFPSLPNPSAERTRIPPCTAHPATELPSLGITTQISLSFKPQPEPPTPNFSPLNFPVIFFSRLCRHRCRLHY